MLPQSVFATPFDNPLVPRFPMQMRNTEILTAFYRTDIECSRQLVPPPLEVTSDIVVIHVYHNAQAPVYRLPVRTMLDGFYWRSDFVLPFGQVIHDYLAS